MKEKLEYISLQEAIKYCNYSQEYLALRARQGKLKAVKFGRNWVTKKEWVKEYVKETETYKQKAVIKKKKVVPPANLPIEEKASKEKVKSLNKALDFRFGFALGLIFILLIAGVFFGKSSFQNTYKQVSPYIVTVSQAGDIVAEKLLLENVSFISKAYGNFFEGNQEIATLASKSGSIIIAAVVKPFKQSFTTVSNDLKQGGVARTVNSWMANIGDSVNQNLIGYFAWLIHGISSIFK